MQAARLACLFRARHDCSIQCELSTRRNRSHRDQYRKGWRPDLRDHTFTLGFVEGPFDDTILNARPIGADEIAVVAAAGHPGAGHRLRAQDLVDQVVIMREPGSGTRAIVEEAYSRIGLNIEPLMSVSDTEAIKRMLLAQHALAYVSALSVKDELRRGELSVIKVDDLRIERPLHMVWLKGRSLSPSSQALFDLVASTTEAPGEFPGSAVRLADK